LPASGWFSTSVTVMLTPTDALSGVAETQWRRSSGLWRTGTSFFATGYQSYDFRSRDNAGNIEVLKTITVPIDLTPPVTEPRYAPPIPASGWFSTPVTVTLVPTDALSGVNAVQYRKQGDLAWIVGDNFTVARDLGDGPRVYEYRASDRAGNIEPTQVLTVFLDTVSPVTTLTYVPPLAPGGWFNTFVTITLVPADPSPGSGVDYTEYRRLGVTTWTTGDTFVTSPGLGDGFYSYEYRARDRAGNIEATQRVTVSIDTMSPTAPQQLAVTPTGWSGVNAFDVSWTNPVQNYAPIARAYYKFGSAPTGAGDASGSVQGANITQLLGLSVPVSGVVPCFVWLEDAAGNADYRTAVSVPLLYSGSAPPAPLLMAVAPDVWSNTSLFDITWVNPVMPSGIQAAWYKWDSAPMANEDGVRVAGVAIQALHLPPPGEGQRPLYVWLEDGAGNKDYRSHGSLVIQYDVTPPTSTLTWLPSEVPPSGWYGGAVTVTITAQDQIPGSGVSDVFYRLDGAGAFQRGTQAIIGTTGVHTFEYYARDIAGNVEITRMLTVSIDRVPPTSTISFVPVLPASGWYNGPVTVTISAQDNTPGSGWAGDSYYRLDGINPFQRSTQLVIAESGIHLLEYYSHDLVGNVEATKVLTVSVDRIAPVTTFEYVPALPSGGWFSSTVTVALLPTDSLAGVAETFWRSVGGSWTRGSSIVATAYQAYEYYSTDRAGNIEATKMVTVPIDTLPPTSYLSLTPTPPASGWYGGPVTVTISAQDNMPGSEWAGESYYRLDGHSEFQRGTQVVVTTDGVHRIEYYSRDAVGNLEGVRINPSVCRIDREPPTAAVFVTGIMGGCDFYTSPVTVTLTGYDALSGIAGFHYQINGGAVVTVSASGALTAQSAFALTSEGRYVVWYWVSDAAGNIYPGPNPVIVRLDPSAPASPINAATSPSSWTRINSFAVCWTNPPDYSGVTTAYYKKGSPPTSNYDGQLVPLTSSSCVSGLTADREGITPLYVWLRDCAGNLDYRTAVVVPLSYDHTAPHTSVLVTSGAQGRNGYYTSPIALRFAITDTVPGVFTTTYSVDGGAETVWDGADIPLNSEGTHTVRFYSIDQAGNVESPPYTQAFKLDLQDPLVSLQVTDYVAGPSVDVSWRGTDTSTGAGIEKYTVQMREGGCGDWVSWLPATTATSGTFTGMLPNRFYYFRVRTEDRAGRVSIWTPLKEVYTEGLWNGDFEAGTWGAWVPTPDAVGLLTTSVVRASNHFGAQSYMALLSKTNWPMSAVPKDAYASFYQPIQLPALECTQPQGLVLSFWYHMLSYDLGIRPSDGKLFDTLEVWVLDREGTPLAQIPLLRDGNQNPAVDPYHPVLYDLGWKSFAGDLTPWAGQQIRIEFRVWNRNDVWLPTWAYVDDVRLLPAQGRIVYLPVSFKASGGRVMSALDVTHIQQPAVTPGPQTGDANAPLSRN
jgi:hypothetical protein